MSELSAVLRMRGMNTAPSIVRREGGREGGGMRELAGRASSGSGRTEEAFDE